MMPIFATLIPSAHMSGSKRADIRHLHTPPSSLVLRYWGAAGFAVVILFYALQLAWATRKSLTR